jgi:carbohydrate diacid regulator
MRLDIRLGGRPARLIILPAMDAEAVPPRIAQGLAQFVASQAMLEAQIPDRQELKNTFVHDLLHGPIDNERQVINQAEILGINLTRPRAAILIGLDQVPDAGSTAAALDEVRLRRFARLVVASVVSFFSLPDDNICAYIGSGEVVVLKASATQDLHLWAVAGESGPSSPSWANLDALKRAASALLCRLLPDTSESISIGIGRYHPGLRGLSRSYEAARAALSLGRRYLGPGRVHCLDELGLPAFVGVSDDATKMDLARYLLGPLDDAPLLVDTLRIFFSENCRPSTTAERMAIHRNTLSYRLDRVASLCGLDPRRFDDAMQLRVALALRDLHAGGSPIPTHAPEWEASAA